MLYGYARVSTDGQDTALQLSAMRRAGVRTIVQEKRSGATLARPELERLLRKLGTGDVLVVYKVDRLARSLFDLLSVIRRLNAAGASLRSLTEPIDTSSAVGEMVLQMLGVIAQFELSLIRERSMAGQEAARNRGSLIGRPRALSENDQRMAYRMVQSGVSMSDVARHYDVHLSSIKRVMLRVDKPSSPAVAMRKPPGS